MAIGFALGLVGAALMFAGDMLLYFTSGRYDMDGTLRPYMEIMRGVSARRVFVGGTLGPVAVLPYVLGFLALPALAVTEVGTIAITVAALLLAFALSCGGAYHAQYVFLSIISKSGHEDLYDQVSDNIMALSRLALLPLYGGMVVLAIAVVAGQTALPPWFAVLTPAVTMLLNFIWMRPAACALRALRRLEQPRVRHPVRSSSRMGARSGNVDASKKVRCFSRQNRLRIIAYSLLRQTPTTRKGTR